MTMALAVFFIVAFIAMCMGNKSPYDSDLGEQMISFVANVLLIPLEYGLASFFLSAVRGERTLKISTLFSGFRDFGRVCGTLLLRFFCILAGTLCCIIPGIVLTYRYAMTPFILCDEPELKFTGALKRSGLLMKGNKADLFWWDCALGAVFAFVTLLFILPCFLFKSSAGEFPVYLMILCGLLFMAVFGGYMIIKNAVYAEFYEKVKGKFEAEQMQSVAVEANDGVADTQKGE